MQKELVRLRLIAQESEGARQIAEAQRVTAEGKLRQMQALVCTPEFYFKLHILTLGERSLASR